MKSIGGYFELELSSKNEYHFDAIRLNTGRNALEYIMLSKKYKKVYMPYYTCDVLLQPIYKYVINFEFYSIDEKFEPIFDFSKIADDECFLYTNYFGLKDEYVNVIASFCKNLVIDNAQSFYSMPVNQVDTFYSPRKFFGVPDGGYLYTNKKLEIEYEKDFSHSRFDHLLTRIDKNAESGYGAFVANDEKLDNVPILEMSQLTQTLLKSIDYDFIAQKRIANYLYLDKELGSSNKLKIDFNKTQVPMVYPFWGNSELRKKLIENKIYTAKYWPNVIEWSQENSLEAQFAEEIIHLPIDQRLTEKELDVILKNIIG